MKLNLQPALERDSGPVCNHGPLLETFSALGLSDRIVPCLEALGYTRPSPIQVACIPHLIAGRDVLGMAQTGSGKTAAFALPALEQLDPHLPHPQLLVLTPTRELAIQVALAISSYAQGIPAIRTVALYGGQRYDIQLRGLVGAQVVVGTPGRLLDHIKQRTLRLSNLKMLVLDEADEMLRMGFIEDVETILSALPAEHQTALFSATMPDAIRRISRRFMRSPEEIKIAATEKTTPGITQNYWVGRSYAKNEALVKFLELESFEAALVFVRTKNATLEVAAYLEQRGYSCTALNGDMTQGLREQALGRLRAGQLNVLVATDVAARGLDVERISLVVNYDAPLDTESYVHRIGRTGRAGRLGKALLFLSSSELYLLKNIERARNTTLTQVHLPTHAQLEEARFERFVQRVEKEVGTELAPYSALLERLQTRLGGNLETVAAALLKYAQRERLLILPPEPPARRERQPREAAARPSRAASSTASAPGMLLYRMALGRSDGVQARHIVGALANEGQLKKAQIGNIKLFDSYSTIELSQGVPSRLLDGLSGIRVFNKVLNLHPLRSA